MPRRGQTFVPPRISIPITLFRTNEVMFRVTNIQNFRPRVTKGAQVTPFRFTIVQEKPGLPNLADLVISLILMDPNSTEPAYRHHPCHPEEQNGVEKSFLVRGLRFRKTGFYQLRLRIMVHDASTGELIVVGECVFPQESMWIEVTES